MKILLTQANLSSFSRVKDGSVKLSFRTTTEINNDEFSLIDQYYNQNGYLAFKLDEVDASEIPEGNTQPGAKSPSQRLRSALYAKYMSVNEDLPDFPQYYQQQMERFINAVTSSIENE